MYFESSARCFSRLGAWTVRSPSAPHKGLRCGVVNNPKQKGLSLSLLIFSLNLFHNTGRPPQVRVYVVMSTFATPLTNAHCTHNTQNMHAAHRQLSNVYIDRRPALHPAASRAWALGRTR